MRIFNELQGPLPVSWIWRIRWIISVKLKLMRQVVTPVERHMLTDRRHAPYHNMTDFRQAHKNWSSGQEKIGKSWGILLWLKSGKPENMKLWYVCYMVNGWLVGWIDLCTQDIFPGTIKGRPQRWMVNNNLSPYAVFRALGTLPIIGSCYTQVWGDVYAVCVIRWYSWDMVEPAQTSTQNMALIDICFLFLVNVLKMYILKFGIFSKKLANLCFDVLFSDAISTLV